ncbi:MAG TPA: OsmC family protein [Capsulimonadaceae bacterium]|nr:OsmC family protein [Capsulimonadaceae bacterium]
MVEIAITYDGNKKCTLQHQDGAAVRTDAPKDIGGDASAFSPTDLVAAALGSCIITTMAMFAERHDLDLAGAKVHVGKEMVAEPTRRIGKLPTTVTLPASVPFDMREALQRVGENCPVVKSINPEIEAAITFLYE